MLKKGNIKIAHEAPLSIFSEVQKQTDYDYFLANLLETDESYRKTAQKAVENGREVILDNGVFETGESLSLERFAEWVKVIKPTYYIVPDVLEDFKKTKKNMSEWNKLYKDEVPGKRIGVVQGKTYRELVKCYRYMDKVADVDKIAIPFDLSYFLKSFPHENYHISYMMGRVKFLGDLNSDGVLNTSKEHHLLGCEIPSEGMFYTDDMWWITSMDTSNPVMSALEGFEYKGPLLMVSKPRTKMYTIMNMNIPKDRAEYKTIIKHIKSFRKYWNLYGEEGVYSDVPDRLLDFES